MASHIRPVIAISNRVRATEIVRLRQFLKGDSMKTKRADHGQYHPARRQGRDFASSSGNSCGTLYCAFGHAANDLTFRNRAWVGDHVVFPLPRAHGIAPPPSSSAHAQEGRAWFIGSSYRDKDNVKLSTVIRRIKARP